MPRTRRHGAIGLLTALLLAAFSAGGSAAAQSDDDLEQRLADRFAPIVVVQEQPEACSTDGEAFFPADVDIVLDNPEVALRQVGSQNPVVMWAPGADDIEGLGDGFFLDFPGSALEPACTYERDFDKYATDLSPTVYAHVVQPPGEPDLLVLQYWLYWYYNDWNNKHESDWEGIALLFEASSVAEALESEPVAVGYAQHEGGEGAEWTDDKLERDGDRPVVYSSAGSHASYFDSAVYLGRGASEGFGCDDTTGPSERLRTRAEFVSDDDTAWLAFEGRWGERRSGPFNGPTGPAMKERWHDPLPWFDGLRDSSVVIPAGDSGAAALVDGFCGLVATGSTALISFKVSPTSMLLLLLVVALLARWIAGRTEWTPVDPTPLRRPRRVGQLVRGAGRTYLRAPLTFALVGLIYLPVAAVIGVVFALLESVPLLGPLIELVRGDRGVNLVSALFVGGLTNVIAAVVVTAVVADIIDHDDRGPAAAASAVRRTWTRRRALAGAFGRSFMIVAALLVTLVLAPWGLRQLVRYQFVPQAVMLDDAESGTALGRSSDLVRGRWWHTAVVVAMLNLSVGVTATAVAMLLLVLVTGVPLWVFSGLVGLTYALTLPLAGIALTLLYGDAVARQDEEHVDRQLVLR